MSEPDPTPSPQIGWFCSVKYLGHLVLCLRCGSENRPANSAHGYSRPLSADLIRPQSQHCHRCGSVIVEGILGHGPDRFPRRGSRESESLPDPDGRIEGLDDAR